MGSYGKLSTAFYDLDKPAAPPDAVAFYLARATRSRGPLLEPMCGSGRFMLPLLEAGVAIEGVDASPEMLAACRQRSAALGLTATLYEQPLDVLTLYGFAEVVDELHLAGFSGARVVPAMAGMSWLQESGCALYECRALSNNADADPCTPT